MTRKSDSRIHIAMPVGDPAGIGPEIALKTVLDSGIQAAAKPVLIADESVISSTAERLGLKDRFADALAAGRVGLHVVAALADDVEPGVICAAAGAACVAYARAAIHMVQRGDAVAVVAGPHNETAVAKAGISFSGYPQLLAETTGVASENVFLMLVNPRLRIVHATLHMAIREALDSLTVELVLNALRAANGALLKMGIARPKIAVCGINPHAGEGGLFGDDDTEITAPAVAAARAEGIAASGPKGADLLFAEAEHDAYIAMYHDQGHIAIKLEGQGTALGISIGAPVLFSTVAHGSAHDIAGTGAADPSAYAGAVKMMAGLLCDQKIEIERTQADADGI